MQESASDRDELTLRELGAATCGLTKNCTTSSTNHDTLSMAEDNRDPIAAWTLDIHEIRIRVLHKAFQLVFSLLVSGQRVQ